MTSPMHPFVALFIHPLTPCYHKPIPEGNLVVPLVSFFFYALQTQLAEIPVVFLLGWSAGWA